MARACAMVYNLIHSEQDRANVGVSIKYTGFQASTGAPWNRLAAHFLHKSDNESFLNVFFSGKMRWDFFNESIPQAKGKIDFIGLNYESSEQVSYSHFHTRRFYPKNSLLSEHGVISNEPEGFKQAIIWASSYAKPILVTENGIEDSNDSIRPIYLADHIFQLWHAYNEGYPVYGYLHRTLVDCFEWENGWSQHYGLWALEEHSQKRQCRDSANFYAAICQKNRLDTDDIRLYAPDVWKRLFRA